MNSVSRAMSVVLAAVLMATAHAATSDIAAKLESAEQLLRAGYLHRAVGVLEPAYETASNPAERSWAANLLGVAYYQMRHYQQAAPRLKEAFDTAPTTLDKARFATDLGNLYAAQRNPDEAADWYRRAHELAPDDVSLRFMVGLNFARLAAPDDKLGRLTSLAKQLPEVRDLRERARYALNLGAQAHDLKTPGLELAYESFELARSLSIRLKEAALLAEALDGLSELYEEQKRDEEALRLAAQGVESARTAGAFKVLIQLEWRRARVLKRLGKTELALAAYQRAVDHIEAVRQDIPIEYLDGKSSFRTTLEPLYLGLADLLLIESEKTSGEEQLAILRRARDTLELLKQSELEDFLGDRCTVDAIRQTSAGTLPPRTAVLYPIVLPDRLELLLETSSGIERRSVAIHREVVLQTAVRFVIRLRDDKAARRDSRAYEEPARQLYDWLLRPVEPLLAEAKTDTLVFVPDGVLRLVPIGALYDGKRFAIEQYAVATVPGLTMTSIQSVAPRDRRILLAGLSEPGPVVSKLPDALAGSLLRHSQRTPDEAETEITDASRSMFRSSTALAEDPAEGERDMQLKRRLALPGVKEEIESLSRHFRGEVLLNESFTRDRFEQLVSSGEYRVVHIASHGVFSGSAQRSFIMAYDDLLTMEALQNMLRAEGLRDQPIELLTLSACQTAEGDDRAPLGLAGAALKARAKSALGTLWPVSDAAAKTLMPRFYLALANPGTTKIKALQDAQLALVNEPGFQHPYFWAPFILVGNWL